MNFFKLILIFISALICKDDRLRIIQAELMENIQLAISKKQFSSFKKKFLAKYKKGDIPSI